MLVSIVIPTRNSESTLGACLESIRCQTYPSIEIVVVDSGSTDNSRRIASEHNAKIVSKNCRMAAARNYGAGFAKGVYLFHMDSDMKLSPRVVEDCVEALKKGACAAVVPQVYEGEGFFGKCRALEFSCLIDDLVIKSSRFMRKTSFENVGGYDENLDAGEDWDITQKIEAYCRIARIGQTLVHGWGKYNFVRTIRKSYNYGKTVKPYLTKHPKYAKHQWGPLRVKHLNYEKLKRDPLHAGGLLFIKLCEFTAGWFGMIVASVSEIVNADRG